MVAQEVALLQQSVCIEIGKLKQKGVTLSNRVKHTLSYECAPQAALLKGMKEP